MSAILPRRQSPRMLVFPVCHEARAFNSSLTRSSRRHIAAVVPLSVMQKTLRFAKGFTTNSTAWIRFCAQRLTCVGTRLRPITSSMTIGMFAGITAWVFTATRCAVASSWTLFSELCRKWIMIGASTSPLNAIRTWGGACNTRDGDRFSFTAGRFTGIVRISSNMTFSKPDPAAPAPIASRVQSAAIGGSSLGASLQHLRLRKMGYGKWLRIE